jgi:uncharacterized membrane protein
MRELRGILVRGLVAVLPVGLTLYLIFWLIVSVEALIGALLKIVLPDGYYWPGLGLLVGLAILFLAGLLVNARTIRHLFRMGEHTLDRIPFVKSIYGAIRDFTGYLSTSHEGEDLKKVVLISFGEIHLIGFLTRSDVMDIVPELEKSDLVMVYLPLSYQIGGYTLLLPRDRIKAIDMPVEDAMRLSLTAGLSRAKVVNPERA